MKSIKLKNAELESAIEFLQSIGLNRKATRGKQKMIERLLEKLKEYAKDEKNMAKKYCELDGEELKSDDNNNLIFLGDTESKQMLNKQSFIKEREELVNETAEVSFAEYSEKYEFLFKELDSDDTEKIEPEFAYIYDRLMTEYENNEEEK